MKQSKSKYHRFSSDERVELDRLHTAEKSVPEIAGVMKRSKNTIRGELARCPKGYYNPIKADKQAHRRRHKEKGGRLTRDIEAGALVIEKLRAGLTPERISGWLRRVEHRFQISTDAIYSFVRSKLGIKLGLHKLLPRYWKHRRKGKAKPAGKSLIPNRRAISERPLAVEDRLEFGHWEADTVIGRRSTGGAILTIVERRSRYYAAYKIASTKKEDVTRALKAFLTQFAGFVKTITFDNGLEFAGHAELHAFGVETFFAEPYSSWQRATNENCNGLLRRFIPKGADLRLFTEQDVLDAAASINSWPKKCLEYAAPSEVFAMLSETEKVVS
jgi:IS30 family transposase